MDDFKIYIEDENELLNPISIKENINKNELFDWQKKAMNYFFNHEKGILEHKWNTKHSLFVVTTGAGKTRFAIEILKKLFIMHPNYKALIVCPKNIIMETGWNVELYNNGISLIDIGFFYGPVKEPSKITITNMQSIKEINMYDYQIVIYDEIHNYGTKRLLEYIEFPSQYKIGLTATLDRIDGNHEYIEKIFDYKIFRYTPQEALDDDILNPFLFTNIGIFLDEKDMIKYEELTAKINFLMSSGGGYDNIMKLETGIKTEMLGLMNARKELINNYYKKFEVMKLICSKHRDDKIIVFNEYNDQTNKVYWHLLDLGLKTSIIHSGIPKQKREEALMNFKQNKTNIILTSKVLDEGTNIPKLDVAIIAAGNSTDRQTIQRMGRVLRKKKTPSHLYQIYCINTVEEEYANERAKLFKELCLDFRQHTFNNAGVLEL